MLLLASVSSASADAQPATAPAKSDARQLVGHTPVLDSAVMGCPEFSFRVRLPDGKGGVGALAHFRPGQPLELVLWDLSDGLPMAIVAQGKMFLYDMRGGRILWADNAVGCYSLGASGDSVTASFQYGSGNMTATYRTRIDLPSLLVERLGASVVIEENADTTRVLAAGKTGGRLAARWQGGEAMPAAFALLSKPKPSGEMGSGFVVDHVVIGPQQVNWSVALDPQKLAESVKLEALTQIGKGDGKSAESQLQDAQKSMFLRLRLRDPASRDRLIQQLKDVDIAQLADSETTLSKAWAAALERAGFPTIEAENFDALTKELETLTASAP
ncbi:MAG: hypothetical protein QM770_02130 [Tepidisphaeraceae bacterium]